MNEEKTNIIPYNNSGGQQPPPKDYSNSNRSKMAAAGQQASSGISAASFTPKGEITEQRDGFFKATLKQAVDHAVKTVIDPMIRNFVYTTGLSILNTLLWNGGKGSPPSIDLTAGKTPYNLISTATAVATSQSSRPQMTNEDRVWQRYEKLHVTTLDKANAIMSKLYRIFMKRGQVRLADYYEAFGEPYAFTDETFGWTSLPQDKMYAQQFADGYHVFMPKLEALT